MPPACRRFFSLSAGFCAEEVVEYCEGAYLEPGANKRDVSLVEVHVFFDSQRIFFPDLSNFELGVSLLFFMRLILLHVPQKT